MLGYINEDSAIKSRNSVLDAILNLKAKVFAPFERVGEVPMSHNKPIVKSRPITLEEAYEVMDDQVAIDALFLRLRRLVFKNTDREFVGVQAIQHGPKFIREAGKVAKDRPYFFLQPLNQEGWLFERTTSGWLVSKAQKIVKSDTFLRSHEPWDVVNLYRPKDGKGTTRVSSQRLGQDLISFAVYENKLNESLGLSPQPDSDE